MESHWDETESYQNGLGSRGLESAGVGGRVQCESAGGGCG